MYGYKLVWNAYVLYKGSSVVTLTCFYLRILDIIPANSLTLYPIALFERYELNFDETFATHSI